jgi:hypothetical protein
MVQTAFTLILVASLDLSDEDDELGDDAMHSLSNCDEQSDAEPSAAPASAEQPIAAFDAARFAVVEDLQSLLRSMQSAVDEQVRLSRTVDRCWCPSLFVSCAS